MSKPDAQKARSSYHSSETRRVNASPLLRSTSSAEDIAHPDAGSTGPSVAEHLSPRCIAHWRVALASTSTRRHAPRGWAVDTGVLPVHAHDEHPPISLRARHAPADVLDPPLARPHFDAFVLSLFGTRGDITASAACICAPRIWRRAPATGVRRLFERSEVSANLLLCLARFIGFLRPANIIHFFEAATHRTLDICAGLRTADQISFARWS